MNGIAEIKNVIPHRFPILLVDRVVEVQPGERLTAHKAITCGEPCYRGLPDSTPAQDYSYPVVLLLESWAQSAGLMTCWGQFEPNVLLGALNDVEFLEPVYPGDLVEHEVRLVRQVGDTAIATGSSTVNGRTVLRVGQVVMAFRAPSQEN